MRKKSGSRHRARQYLVHFCCILLGINSLIATNGLWVELPVMLPSLPEGWELPAYLTILIQIANIGPILYSLASYLYPKIVTEERAIYGMLIVGSLSAFCLTLFWSQTVWLLGSERSLPLLILTFFLSLVDSISSVVCLPYMAEFPVVYVSSYMIGEGLSGFFPSMIAMAQGVDEYTLCNNVTIFNASSNATEFHLELVPPKPNFPPEIFFGFLLMLLLMSAAGFIVLNHLPMAKKERAKKQEKVNDFGEECHRLNLLSTDINVSIQKQSGPSLILLLVLQGWVSALGYGVFPSVQSYSCLPYGSEPYHYAVVLASLATPVACVIAMFIPLKCMKIILGCTGIGTVISVYIMVTAVMSPFPPMTGTTLGSGILITCWILFTGVFGYVKVMIASMCRDIGHRALFWCGALTQAGSAIGALIMFLLVSVFDLFHEKEPC